MINILIVDDVEVNRLLLSLMIESDNVKIIEAINGKDAIDKILENDFDIVLMDYEMPILNGGDAALHIRKTISKNLPIILITAHSNKESIPNYNKIGFNEIIYKPINRNKLLNFIELHTNKKI